MFGRALCTERKREWREPTVGGYSGAAQRIHCAKGTGATRTLRRCPQWQKPTLGDEQRPNEGPTLEPSRDCRHGL